MDSTNEQVVWKEIQSLNERTLVEEVILPLISRLQFDRIEVRHGPYERGVDILCLKKDELDGEDLLGIQVKRLKFTGKATDSGHLHGVLNQLSQCLEEPVNLINGTKRQLDRIWLISPYELNISALETSIAKYQGSVSRRLRIVDGLQLFSLLRRHAPDVLAKYGDQRALYRQRLEREVAVLHEAAALRLREKPTLETFYVPLALSVPVVGLRHALARASVHAKRRSTKESQRTGRHCMEIGTSLEALIQFNPVLVRANATRARKSKTNTMGKAEKEDEPTSVVRIDSPALCERLRQRLTYLVAPFEDPSQNQISQHRSLSDLLGFVDRLEAFRRMKGASIVFSDIDLRNPREHTLPLGIGIADLLSAKRNFLLVGPAGAGKTTLLRLIAKQEAGKPDGRLPVVARLAALGPRQTIPELLQDSLAAYDLNTTTDGISRMLAANELLVLFDGLDEVIGRRSGVFDEIAGITKSYPACQCLISSRAWSANRIEEARVANLFVRVDLLPFSDLQVQQFFHNWFEAEPEVANEVLEHIEKSPELHGVISNPLLATILAVVKVFGGSLPTSLLELYQERLRLLLHDWDSVKKIRRDNFEAADKRFFLRKLAVELHRLKLRTTSWDELCEMARKVVGAVKSRRGAENFLRELVNNNDMLFKDEYGNWGLGHLQYQEYLVALEAKENPRVSLAPYLEDSWWADTLEMYARMTLDIAPIIYDCVSKRRTFEGEFLQVLWDLLEHAPNTEARARGFLERAKDQEVAVERSFAKYSDEDILSGYGRPR